MPLASTFVLSKKKGNEAWVKLIPEGNKIRFEVQSGKCPKEYESFKIGRSALFKCPCCGEVTTDAYVKQHGKAHELGCQLMAVVGKASMDAFIFRRMPSRLWRLISLHQKAIPVA